MKWNATREINEKKNHHWENDTLAIFQAKAAFERAISVSGSVDTYMEWNEKDPGYTLDILATIFHDPSTTGIVAFYLLIAFHFKQEEISSNAMNELFLV